MHSITAVVATVASITIAVLTSAGAIPPVADLKARDIEVRKVSAGHIDIASHGSEADAVPPLPADVIAALGPVSSATATLSPIDIALIAHDRAHGFDYLRKRHSDSVKARSSKFGEKVKGWFKKFGENTLAKLAPDLADFFTGGIFRTRRDLLSLGIENREDESGSQVRELHERDLMSFEGEDRDSESADQI